MTSLRLPLAVAGLMLLSASTLSAQSTRISCKDGSKPKVGHFACWGHGGLVREAANSEAPATKSVKKEKVAKKTTAKPAHAKTKTVKKAKKTDDKHPASKAKKHAKKKKAKKDSSSKTNDER